MSLEPQLQLLVERHLTAQGEEEEEKKGRKKKEKRKKKKKKRKRSDDPDMNDDDDDTHGDPRCGAPTSVHASPSSNTL